MGRPTLTTFTADQLATARAAAARDAKIATALRTPACRAGAKFGSYAGTASEALADLRALCHNGGSLLAEAAEMPVVLFLSACGNAERAWDAEGLPVPAAAARRLAGYKAEYGGLVAGSRFLPL